MLSMIGAVVSSKAQKQHYEVNARLAARAAWLRKNPYTKCGPWRWKNK